MTTAEKTKDVSDANEKAAAETEAAKAKPGTDDVRSAKQKATDAEDEAERDKDGPHVNNPRAPEAVAKQHELVDKLKEDRNEANRPGHEKNMERLEHEAQEAQARTEHAHDPRANHVPTGKQDNRNTPRIDADGTKHWD